MLKRVQATASACTSDSFCDHLTLFRSFPVRDSCVKFPGIWKRSVEIIQLLHRVQQVLGATPYHLTEVCRRSFFQKLLHRRQRPSGSAVGGMLIEGCEGANMFGWLFVCLCVWSNEALTAMTFKVVFSWLHGFMASYISRSSLNVWRPL